MKPTKDIYRQILNLAYDFLESDKRGTRGQGRHIFGATKRKYDDYLYFSDKPIFNDTYYNVFLPKINEAGIDLTNLTKQETINMAFFIYTWRNPT